ncbi:MAG: hypothetical protein V3T42_03185 [Nitrospirales bacterium]|jgi:hypothetical protein
MTVAGLETLQFSPNSHSVAETQPVAQVQKQVTALEPSQNDTEKARREPARDEPSRSQDHVTLSKEAQILSAHSSQPSNNNTFQQSPLDR